MSPDEASVGSQLGGFRIDAELGRGGMGVVYLAEQLSLRRRVALKVISPGLASDPDFRSRFEREAMMAASLDHPNVVPVYEAGAVDGLLYLSMRYVEGTDLRTMLMEGGAAAPSLAAHVAEQIAAALDAAHARGLVHRDVKPANVLLSGTGPRPYVYLTDFGLTKEASAPSSGFTGTGHWVGTVDYSAPEQIEGRPIDARTDVYALGCTIFHALAGRAPFTGTDVQKIYAHVSRPPPNLADVNANLAPFDAVISRAMAKDPEERFPSAGDFARALTATIVGGAPTMPERSVATGPAEPTVASSPIPTSPTEAELAADLRRSEYEVASTARLAAPPAGRRRISTRALAIGGLLVVAGGAAAAVIALNSGGSGGSGPNPEPPKPPPDQPEVRYKAYTSDAGGYVASLPTGDGWSSPLESEPNPGHIFETSLSGPHGLVLRIDSTPVDKPEFGGTFQSRRVVPQPAFGSAVEYVFQGGNFAECQSAQCVDYQMTGRDGTSGFAVLAGGTGDFDLAQKVASHVTKSLAYPNS